MIRPKPPAVKLPTLDAADRRILGIAAVLVLAWLLACATLGLGVRVFWIAAGW